MGPGVGVFMSLEADAIVERRRLKRSRALWRFGALGGVVAAVAALLLSFGMGGIRLSHVAKIELYGVIYDDPRLIEAIDGVAEDDSAKALVLAIDSPGGTVTGSEAIYNALRRVAAEKPVVAVMGSLAASGGYVAALGADHIVAQRNTITGSIGVIMQVTEISGLLEKVGVSVSEIKSGPLKAEPSFVKPMSEDARKATESLVMDAYDWFLGLVTERRKLAPETARLLSDGRVYSGKQALEAKLIDAIGDERVARQWLEKEYNVAADLPEHTVNPYGEIAGFGLDQSRVAAALFTLLTGKSLDSKRLTLDGLVAIWHPDL